MAKVLVAIVAACVVAGILVAAAISLGVGQDAPEALDVQDTQDTRMVVYASFFPYYEFTKAVAGDAAYVSQFQPPGVDAHDWEPTASQIANLTEARAFVYNGLGMESYVERIRESGEFKGTFISAGGHMAEDERGHDDEDERGHDDEDERGHDDEDERGHDDEDERGHGHEFTTDPHIWLDPVLAKEQVDRILEGLSDADPENADVYARNAAEFKSKLDDLDAEIASRLSECGGREFMTMHSAFAYFADRYDLEEVPLGGLSPEGEPSAARIATAVDVVRDRGVPVFYAESEDARMAEAIAAEAGTEARTISTLEAPGDTTYLDRMQANLDALAVALDCR